MIDTTFDEATLYWAKREAKEQGVTVQSVLDSISKHGDGRLSFAGDPPHSSYGDYRSEHDMGTELDRDLALAKYMVEERLLTEEILNVQAPGADPLEAYYHGGLLDKTEVVLRNLPEGLAAPFLMHISGETDDEISRQLNIAPGTVRTRLHRARRRLSSLGLRLGDIETPTTL